MTICNESKRTRTISTSDGFGVLQMVSEPNIERCVSEDAGLPKGWIMKSHISWRGERNIPYKGVETSS